MEPNLSHINVFHKPGLIDVIHEVNPVLRPKFYDTGLYFHNTLGIMGGYYPVKIVGIDYQNNM